MIVAKKKRMEFSTPAKLQMPSSFLFSPFFSRKSGIIQMGMRLLAVLVLLAAGFGGTAAQLQQDDLEAMLALKKALKLTPALDWSDASPCKWSKVQCSSSGDRITRIQIGGQGLTGELPPDLNKLNALVKLEVMKNNLTGDVPSLAGLSQLQVVLLHTNQFSSFPSDFFSGMTSLQVADVGYNPFSEWQIPYSLLNATSLQNFSANSANLVGKVPDFFTSENFPSLIELQLAMNNLQGPLPKTFAGSSLQTLWLNGQQGSARLNGTIEVLANMTELGQVWLHGNQFTGPIPDLSNSKNLRELSLRDNQLTGIVPESLMKLPSLHILNLTNNLLQGPTPLFSDSVQVDMSGLNSFCLPTPGAPCNSSVNTLLSIIQAVGYPVKFALDWKGNNPCDNSKSWTGITCSGSDISIINFQRMDLSGTISPSYASLAAVRKILLSRNNLYGTIPVELTKLTSLEELDVSYNNLHGDIPSFRSNVKIVTDGNVNIGKDVPAPAATPGGPDSPTNVPDGKPEGKSKLWQIVGAIVGVVGLLAAVFFLGFLYKRRKKSSSKVQSPTNIVIHPQNSGGDQPGVKITIAGAGSSGNGSETYTSQGSGGTGDVHVVEAGNMVISIQVLRNVTNNFSEDNILGRGGFGTVYKGELHDGTKIAVKRMESSVLSQKGFNEFKSEIAVLTKVRHRHLVALQGYCMDENERLLVYEYMPQGTLSRFLFHWDDEGLKPLEWTRRLSIALDVARGVEYLHSLAHQTFIHRDLKPSNILLGDDMRAKVADFGLVRLAPEGKGSFETCLAGTFGYLAPEYAVTGRVTTKVDVFSFGVILMEMISGRKALDETQPEDSIHLVTWFRRMHLNKDTFRKSIDPTIDLSEETLASISTVAELAGHCCAREPYQRPDMGHAVNVLSSLVELWKPSEPDSEDIYGIDLDMTLPQALKKWQEYEGMSNIDESSTSSSYLRSGESTQTSIPTRPSGFASSFTSADGR